MHAIMQGKLNKRLLLLMSFLLPVGLALGQYTITIVPSGVFYLKSQLWNLSVTSIGSSTVQAQLHLEMKEAGSGQPVLSALSAPFSLRPGATLLQARALEPITYFNENGSVNASSGSLLPVGKYVVCYELTLTYRETQAPVAESCEDVEVEPMSPPVLIMPEDDSTVMTSYPDFSWMPPGPAGMFTDLRYDLMISPVNEGQSSTDAIQKNLPLQQAQGLQQPYFTFSAQGPQLEAGQVYAWQVVARDGQQYSAKSEVWTFRMPDAKTLAVDNSLIYLQMDDRAGGVATTEPGLLHLKLVSPASTYNAQVVFKDPGGNILETVQRQIRQGDNFLQFSLNGRFQSKHSYSATVSGPAGQKNTISFSIK
jgi:hypothetical protein